jgi:hypothetical protein
MMAGRHAFLVDEAPDMVVWVEPTGRIMYVTSSKRYGRMRVSCRVSLRGPACARMTAFAWSRSLPPGSPSKVETLV